MHSLAIQFEYNIKKYNDFRLKVEGLIRELLIQNNISYHKIESRVKNVQRLDEKISRKQKYSDLADITDLIGVRVITYFEDDVDKIAGIIDKEFIKDEQNSIDKRILDSDKFGYRSLHEVVSLNEDRKGLTEYKRFKDIKFEIQIRSILQHAWAEIEHDLGYKTESAIPNEFKRSFYRVAALLETADLEFLKIRDGLEKYEIEIGKKIEENPDKVDINSASLKSFVEENEAARNVDVLIANETKTILKPSYSGDDKNVDRLKFVEIFTIKQLEDVLEKFGNEIAEYAKEWSPIYKDEIPMEVTNNYFHRGISIFYLAYYLVGKKQELPFALEYVSEFFNENRMTKKEQKEFAENIIKVYSKLLANKKKEIPAKK